MRRILVFVTRPDHHFDERLHLKRGWEQLDGKSLRHVRREPFVQGRDPRRPLNQQRQRAKVINRALHSPLTPIAGLAINLYLAHKFGGLVAPVTPQEDALATQWSCWALTEIEKPLLLAAANLKLFDAELRDAQEVEIAVKKLSRPWGVLEKHLTGRPYMLGERFTVADLNIAAVMTLALSCGVDLDAWPRMEAWLHACLCRRAATDWRTVSFRIPRPPSALGVLSMFV